LCSTDQFSCDRCASRSFCSRAMNGTARRSKA
jgi:hypothetical protein